MIAVSENQGVYLENFSQLERERSLLGQGQGWIDQIRGDAIDRFAELGFPTTRIEDWKYTNVAPIANIRFEPAQYEFSQSIAQTIKSLPFGDLGCSRLVFVNGFYCPELSSVKDLPAGVKACSLATAFSESPTLLEQYLARYASFADHAFVALNTAFMNDGGFIHIPKGLVLERPIYLLFVSTGGDKPAATHPRTLILVERESQATIIEGYMGLDVTPGTRNSGGLSNVEFRISSFENVYFTNAVTEMVVDEGAVVHYAKVQRESERAFHIATVQVQQERSSNVTTHSIAFGSTLAREALDIVLGGEGAESQLNGLYVIAGSQHVDNHTTIDHAKPHCNSREVYKGVLDGRSAGVFNGKIKVRKDAQKTDAKQSNKNLLLSEDAVINTKPQLEIYADDVKCTHGATIGQIDQEAIFYLRSRGIGIEEARSLLTYAFANDVLERITYKALRDRLRDALFARLAKQAGEGESDGRKKKK